MDDEDLAIIRAAFQSEFVQGQGEFFLGRLPLREELREDERARRALQRAIIVRRPQAFLSRRPGVGLPRQAAIELSRRNVLYLVRLAPLTQQTRTQEWTLSPAGNFFSTLRRQGTDIAAYRTRYAAKFGFTTRSTRERFKELVPELISKGFPTENLSPFYAVSIDGFPPDRILMQHMESGLRNLFDRQDLRLRQHARGVLHPGNRSVLAETFEFVYTDALCNTPFNLFQKFGRRLDAGRRWVGTLVRVFDARRERIVQDERNEILWRYDADIDGFVLGHDQAVMEEELQSVEANHPRLDVRHLYFSVLEYAAATIIVRP